MPDHTVPFPASIERVAYHEAGHVVVTYELTGLIAGSIRLSQDSSGFWVGDNQPDPNPQFKISVMHDTLNRLVPATADGWAATIAGMLAGRDAVAEALRLAKFKLPPGAFENYPGEAGFVSVPGVTAKIDHAWDGYPRPHSTCDDYLGEAWVKSSIVPKIGAL